MKRYLFGICTLALISGLMAQTPRVDLAQRGQRMALKSEHYRQLYLRQQQISSNQAAYDVGYYDLDLTIDPQQQTLSGIVEVAVTVTDATLDHLELNFWDGMSISAIYDAAGTQELGFSRGNDILDITLDRSYSQGEQIRLTIHYQGRPQDSRYYSFHFDHHNGQDLIWTISSVFGGRAWWPSKDIPSDKPDSMDIHVTVPSHLIVASNGVLRETTLSGNLKTYHWHEKYPIASYLVSLAIHPYEMHYDFYLYNDGVDTMMIEFYSFAGNYQENQRINGLVKDILRCYADLFGEYPFVDEKYGQADFGWGGGMEHQTCTSYGSWSEGLYAHEIAHQWWGDMITCDSFHHIWLNEGFASYCEALWFEHAIPGYTASEYQMMYQLYLGPGTVYVEDPLNEDIFDSGLSYVKASWILHMLRHVVGDDIFFDILRAYYHSAGNQYGTATTADFQAVCEQVSGRDLDKFFHQWVYEDSYPHYALSWDYERHGSQYEITLDILQEQENYAFWMPLDVMVTTAEGERNFIVWDSLAQQSFVLSVDARPESIELDPHDWVLKKVRGDFQNPSFAQGILVVNGIDWETYGDEVLDAYEARAFWGEFPISFWDCFYPSDRGYPSTLPEPLGRGRVPAPVLGQFSTVIWVGNNYNGDLGSWQLTPIMEYVRAGGNVLLLGRRGQDFIDDEMRDYLGIQWMEYPMMDIDNCVADVDGLVNMEIVGAQSLNALFSSYLSDAESTLLFRETATYNPAAGIGVWHHPAEGGSHRADGAQFVFISGRPYRYNSAQLRSNIEHILGEFLGESKTIPEPRPTAFHLQQNYPNPFNRSTTIRYRLDRAMDIRIAIYDLCGNRVSVVLDRMAVPSGRYEAFWDGCNDEGVRVSSGVYFYELQGSEQSSLRKMLLLK